jgi:hypothetical protein
MPYTKSPSIGQILNHRRYKIRKDKMSEENNVAPQPTVTHVVVQSNPSNALGIASFVFGILSIFILAPLFVPLAMILGIIAVIKKQLLWGILGMVCALAGIATSPIFLGLMGLASIGAMQ